MDLSDNIDENTVNVEVTTNKRKREIKDVPNYNEGDKIETGKIRKTWRSEGTQSKKSFSFASEMRMVMEMYEEIDQEFRRLITSAINDPAITDNAPGWEQKCVDHLKGIITFVEEKLRLENVQLKLEEIVCCLQDSLEI